MLENNYTELLAAVEGKYPADAVERCINFLEKKDVGTVTSVTLCLYEGELEGYVHGTNGSYRLWQSVCVSSKGREYLRMNVSQM